MHPDPATAAAAPVTGSGRTGLLALLWVGWVLVPAGFVVAGLRHVLVFFGESPTDAEEADARRMFVLAAVAAVAIPVVGLVLSLYARRPGSATAFAIATGLAAVGALVLVVATAPAEPRSAIPSRDPGGACQEHSGGDTRCPGG